MPEDVPVPGGVRVAEGVPKSEYIQVPKGLRVLENIRVPEHFRNLRVLERRKLKLPDTTRPEKMFYPHTPNRYTHVH